MAIKNGLNKKPHFFIFLFNCLIKKNAPCKNLRNFTVSVLRYSYVVPQLHKWKSGNFWKPWFLGLGLPEFEILWICFMLGLYQSKKSSIVKIGDFGGFADVWLTRSSTVKHMHNKSSELDSEAGFFQRILP